ncbi:MAG TPA: bifunctional 3-phenylpropionate/cinnamic acid dioxygenase ferredoxin subunit [Pseudonocardia sp.]|jgi:3-phenylpropionate/trans-cinnamate dioxygenase ferredoxin subunit
MNAPRRVRACRLDELPDGQCVRLDTEPPIAVFRVEGTLHAIDDTCSHEDASLADGWVEGCYVECPLHGSRFDLRTGEPEDPPAYQPVRVHGVAIEDGVIVVEVAAPAPGVGGHKAIRSNAS